jgi:polyhydroxyalkanoate synthesis regulator phasin
MADRLPFRQQGLTMCHCQKKSAKYFFQGRNRSLFDLNIHSAATSAAIASAGQKKYSACARFLNGLPRIHIYSLTLLFRIKMDDLFKKFVYTGVGLVSTTVEKFQKSVEKLVDEDKISQEEGKKLVDDLFKNTEAKREEFEAKMKKVVEEVLVRMNLATQSQIQELQDRLAVIETQLGIEVPAKKEESKSKKKAPKKDAVQA